MTSYAEPSAALMFNTLRSSASNVTSLLTPSTKDLLLLVPRIVARAGNFATITVPDMFENIFGEGGGRLIAEATAEEARNLAAASGSLARGATATAMNAGANAAGTQQSSSLISAFSFAQVRTFGGIFTYLTSKWAIACFAVAVVLNRTQIYASARHHLNLGWQLRMALRIVPILLFISLAQSLVQSLRCQTSRSYSTMRYGAPGKNLSLDFASDGGLLYKASSVLLFWETDVDSCLAVNMIPAEDKTDLHGSLSLLWPVFQSLCLSQFVETLSCAVQGRPIMAETGMSLFEHSLAFAEAEAMATSHFTFSPIGTLRTNLTQSSSLVRDLPDSASVITKSVLLGRLNTPPEVLLMALISCMNNLSSHVLGVLGLQSKFRLINTGLWGICFMGSFAWGMMSFSFDHGVDAGLLRYPTVCVVGFIPHILIFVGITVCGLIYCLALILSIISPPAEISRATSWRERFWLAQGNMQANIQLSTLQINMHEDFYTALLRMGFSALTAASEAVFLNEGRRINVGHWTWLEEARMNEVRQSRAAEDFQAALQAQLLAEGETNNAAAGVAFAEEDKQVSLFNRLQWKSGYARERSTKALKSGNGSGGARFRADGVGALQRGGRYILAYGFLTNIFWLITGWLALSFMKVLGKIGISRRPRWLMSAMKPISPTKPQAPPKIPRPSTLDFWLLSDEGDLALPADNNVDVEKETKKRLRLSSGVEKWGRLEEQQLDSSLYTWFTSGGWWGEKDSSGEYIPPSDDDGDNTSLISNVDAASTASYNDWEPDMEELTFGQRTPTQSSPYPRSRSSTPEFDLALDPSALARLLNPQDPEQRSEARILAHHLASPCVVTRSQYKHTQVSSATRVLTSTRYRPPGFAASASDRKLMPHEEAEVLEYLILKARAKPSPYAGSSAWRDGAEGLGAGGPQCVVCQSAPRTILAWPCRCLSLCEDCRVSLAMNNFATCVCCRQEVVGFSRLFVP